MGNLHKPHDQTTLLPPSGDDGESNVAIFLDDHEVGKIPGIGFKIAQKLRALVEQQSFRDGKADEKSREEKEEVLVGDVRRLPGIGPDALEQVLAGPGIPHGIGKRIWDLLNGRDDTEVGQARDVPRQISIEDSYGRLNNEVMAVKELQKLAVSLIKRMHADLTSIDISEDDGIENPANQVTEVGTVAADLSNRRWLAFPKSIRLSTLPRGPVNPDGSRIRSSTRGSRSAPMPNFVFSFKDSVADLAGRLVADALLPLFRKLHPERNWNLVIMNVAATNIVDAASEKGGPGRDIAKMFRRQDTVLRPWKVEEGEGVEEGSTAWVGEEKMEVERAEEESDSRAFLSGFQQHIERSGSEDVPTPSQEGPSGMGEWEESGDDDEDMTEDDLFRCERCDAIMPVFAVAAHDRWHAGT